MNAAVLLTGDLPIALANTVRLRRGRRQDAIETPAGLAAWLAETAPALRTALPERALAEVGEADASEARHLRDSIRSIIESQAAGEVPAEADRERLNRHAAAAPGWPRLDWDDDPVLARVSAAAPVAAALAEIAGAAIELFCSEQRHLLSACAAPDCIRLFAKTDPRRKWCSPDCGNRARVNRHYRKRSA